MKKRFRQYIIAIVILLINVLAYIQYTGNINKRLETQTQIHLKALIDETTECINIKLEERINAYKAVATLIGNLDDVDMDIINKALRNQADMAGYTDYDLIDMKGMGLEGKGNVSYAENEYFKKASEGKVSMVATEDTFGSIKGIDCYVPVCKGEAVKGVFKVYSTVEQFTELVDIADLGEYGNVFVVMQDGTLISRGYGLDEVENIKMILINLKLNI